MKCLSQYIRIMSLKMRWVRIWATFGIQTITDGGGIHILPCSLQGTRHNDRRSYKTWLHQIKPSLEAWRAWHKTLCTQFCMTSASNRLQRPLGIWQHNGPIGFSSRCKYCDTTNWARGYWQGSYQGCSTGRAFNCNKNIWICMVSYSCRGRTACHLLEELSTCRQAPPGPL